MSENLFSRYLFEILWYLNFDLLNILWFFVPVFVAMLLAQNFWCIELLCTGSRHGIFLLYTSLHIFHMFSVADQISIFLMAAEESRGEAPSIVTKPNLSFDIS